MTTTVVYDPNKDWLKKWLRLEPHVVLGPPEAPYLKRWLVVPRNKFRFNIYLHKFCSSDEDRALHDHPWPWWSFLLSGAYTEHTADGVNRRKRFSLVHRPGEFAHRVELDRVFPAPDAPEDSWQYKAWLEAEKPAWTLFFTGEKYREWGFHCPNGWRHWEKFTQGATPTNARGGLGCGEE